MTYQAIYPPQPTQPALFYLPQPTPKHPEPTMGKNSGNKKRMLLEIPYTKRDIEIIYTVFVLKYITTVQIWLLFFSHTKNIKVCQQRLRKLWQYGLVRAIEQAHKRGEGRPPYIWALDVLGGELLVQERGVDPKLINTKPRADEDRSLSIKHTLLTTSCWIAFRQAGRREHMTLEWVTEREIRSLRSAAAVASNADEQELKTPIPDGLFTITRQTKSAVFHLEVDRSTEDIGLSTFERQSISAKVIEYLAWEGKEQYRREFGTRPLRVCFVTIGAQRMRNMIKASENMIQQWLELRTELSDRERQAETLKIGKRFRFITFSQVQAETLLTQPVWSLAGDDKLHTLFD